MFGILRPCRHTLPGDLASAWMSHLCGLCLALRDDHGQLARVATNYDGLVISALAAAQSAPGTGTRAAGPCPLRGMRRAEVAEGEGARLAATVSLLLASTKVGDHVSDGDGAYARPPVRGVARKVAERWARQAQTSGKGLGFDGRALLAVVARQSEVEAAAEVGSDVLAVTAPTEQATGEAFAHTAVLTGRTANEAPLREAGRLFGRVAHLLDAVEDQDDDLATGAWNPITATGADIGEIRRLCDDAVLGVRLALDEAEFTDGRLVYALLDRELTRAVGRTFSHAGHPPPQGPGHHRPHYHDHPPRGPQMVPPPGQPGYGNGPHPGAQPSGGGGWIDGNGGEGHGGWGGGGDQGGHDGGSGRGGRGRGPRPAAEQGGCACTCNCETPTRYEPPKRRGLIAGCAVALFMCCTCQQCCRDPYPGPWSGRLRRTGNCDCGNGGGSPSSGSHSDGGGDSGGCCGGGGSSSGDGGCCDGGCCDCNCCDCGGCDCSC